MRGKPIGLILAGGLSRRMGGGDKAMKTLGGETILSRIARRLAPQVTELWLNANGDTERFGLDLPVVPDSVPDTPGPLAGILAGLDHAAAHPSTTSHVLSVPADCPFLPDDLVTRLVLAAGDMGSACAASGGRVHGVVGLWPVAGRESLRHLLVEEGVRRVDGWLERARAARVEWPALPYDPFFNVNTPEDLAAAEDTLKAYPTA